MTLELLLTKRDLDISSITSSKAYTSELVSLREYMYRTSSFSVREESSLVRSLSFDFITSYFALSKKLSDKNLVSSSQLRDYSLNLSSGYILEKYLSNNLLKKDYSQGSIKRLHQGSNKILKNAYSKNTFSSESFIFSLIKNMKNSYSSNKKFISSPLNFASKYYSELFFQSFYSLKNAQGNSSDESILSSKIIINNTSFVPKKLFDRLNPNPIYKTKKRVLSSKENEVQQKAEDKFDLDLHTITLSKQVTYDEVQGNKKPKDFLTSAVKDLLLYNSKTNTNPLLKFGSMNNLALLAGDAGTGKTFTANYAISLANTIAKKYDLDFEAIKLSIESSYQDGSVLMLKNQLDKITQSKKAHIIFLDDCEKFFPNRRTSRLDYKKDVVTEFLHFTQGLNGYKMKGNYLLIATANLPESLDKAVLSRFGDAVFHCEGPITPEEKANVLKNNLSTAISDGFVDISDWSAIGQYAQKYNLKGRDLSNIAKSLLRNSRSNMDYDSLYKNMSSPNKLYSLLKNSYQKITQDDVFKGIEEIANQAMILKNAQDSYESSA